MLLSFVIYMTVFCISSIGGYLHDRLVDKNVNGASIKFDDGIRINRNFIIKIACDLLVIAPPVILSAFRDIHVGTDTESYLRIYQFNKQYNFIEYLKVQGSYLHDIEIGYQQICHLAYIIGGGYNLVNAICEFLIIFFTWTGFKYYHREYGIDSGMGMYFFYLLEFSYGWDGTRFAIGLAIFFYAIRFLLHKQPGKYIALCILCSLFHVSLIIAVMFYMVNFVSNKGTRKNGKYIAFTAVAFIVVFLRPIVNHLLPIATRYIPKLDRYSINTSENFGFGLIIIILVFLLPLIRWERYVNENKLWMPLLIVILSFIPLRFMGYFSPWLIRLSRMPEMLLCLLYGGIIKISKDHYDRLFWKIYAFVFFIALYVYIAIVLGKDDVYPYVLNLSNIQ